MGQKIHPRGFRLGYIQDWQSKWFSVHKMPELIGEDFEIRRMVRDRFNQASVSWVGIERAGSYLKLTIHTARPGIVIGRRGMDIENLKKDIEALTSRKVFINVSEIKIAEMDARLVGQSIAQQLEKRIGHKKAIKRAMERTMGSGALGIKIMVSGRLGGSEIARREQFRKGRVPLQTLSADIDYGLTEANTVMGKIGVKVWIFKKLFFAKTPRELMEQLKKLQAETPLEVPVNIDQSKPQDSVQ
ncbi:MAG: 30S ribosomal protein S3 [Elusimicrobia bacterium GWA2_56_46]|nr:MAG: 30S ribosomal protein S3 [Elusimicrobia bacterium GWA2_56_46]OGR55016.1 MAG: 30S ribosomal protein S3 [Elusimicrobia bacterium GWC2_56_31]HBW23971.1 30S ribosomal protein S3 [Elusimicrobiota bacterium]